ncbi:ATP synthase F0 subunit A [Candidatus Marinamargulisbacteria bacterium SCGC AAA071-K20]|nr:ATP synthase F0 subunit A [Candidatus Marinamargulisbacteria bacterium SCGC AAA071-K20]
MDQLGKVTLFTFNLLGKSITINPTPIIMMWIVMALLVVISLYSRRHFKLIPGKIQSLFELIYEFLEEITVSTLGKKDGPRYVPFIVTLFIFILVANYIGIFPNLFQIGGTAIALVHKLMGGNIQIIVEGPTSMNLISHSQYWYTFLLDAPFLEEPTKSVNTDLALGLIVFLLVHAYGIKNKGIYKYIRSFADDPFEMKGAWIIFFFLNPFFYLNLIGMVANVVSHSFRLFGNIFGGSMIIVIVSSLLKFFLLPVGLFAFFGLFAGLVQAFVFTMLAVTYIQQQQ